MTRRHLHLATSAILFAATTVLTGCNSDEKPAPTAHVPKSDSEFTTQKGVAGGVAEDVYITQVVVTGVDQTTRKVTLKDSEGHEYPFTASPAIKNLPQLKVNDKVTATFARRMVVSVQSDDNVPSYTQSSMSGTAQPGEKPGMLVAEESKAVARIVAMDTTARTADLQFVDGTVKGIPVRSDVDMSKYKVGDNVTIRITRALTVLTESPQQ